MTTKPMHVGAALAFASMILIGVVQTHKYAYRRTQVYKFVDAVCGHDQTEDYFAGQRKIGFDAFVLEGPNVVSTFKKKPGRYHLMPVSSICEDSVMGFKIGDVSWDEPEAKT